MRDFFKKPLSTTFRSVTNWYESVYHISILDVAKQRVVIVTVVFLLAFFLVLFRLADVMLLKQKDKVRLSHEQDFQVHRNDILDRNNEILATNVVTASAYVNAKKIIDIDDAIKKLKSVLPECSENDLRKKLGSSKSFVWLARHITPKLQQAINDLGIPGIYLSPDQTRVYPHGSLCSHIIGFCGLEGDGLSGIERYFDAELQRDKDPIKLSLDLRVQHILREELLAGVKEFSAKGGNAIAMHVKTGEILGMVSLPDFNPHALSSVKQDAFFNRNTLGVYEPGSVYKILNVAIGLETGKTSISSVYDTSTPISIGKFKITDFRAKSKLVSLQEAFMRSSNIASVKICQQFGVEYQKKYLKRFGALEKLSLELPEIGAPITPKNWTEASMMTISYGYGISQTPLQVLYMINALVNGGSQPQPTLLKRDKVEFLRQNLVSEKTSKTLRELMRVTISEGTARKANVEGFDVFGKTGTVYQQRNGGYGSDADRKRTTTFVGGFPASDPQVIFVIMLDTPKATSETFGFATAGWNVAKIAGKVIARVGPLYMNPNHKLKDVTAGGDAFEQPKICSISMKDEINDEEIPF